MVKLRAATIDDAAAIRAVLIDAFPTPSEADLVDRLRSDGDLVVEWVAESDEEIVGCIQYSPLILRSPDGDRPAVALAPVAVRPDHQGQGVGQALIRRSLAELNAALFDAVVVLGDPAYYPRFGFSAEMARQALEDPFTAGDAFMTMELRQDALTRSVPVTPIYASAFGMNQA